ncbi:hypothetical protein T4A_3700 [Trichinella pseudospiralis]|uniref:Uncharacterized protein n=1 Tax=Trichinella pseudospiralis TaxID=6337 RepID=A0A0V1EJ86_TRIPS|nr:hypothetical protein T4A_10974 [Trichinella pseudospiralis]KRY69844.1 hypothetical protein T4A_13714 [Trichinella pseudospiralis]KRY73863.1 hypothetical protein T4A_3700 [Trichinella pseudospiralis]
MEHVSDKKHYLQRVPQRIRIHASEYAKNVSDIHFCTFMYQDIIFKDSNLLLAEILFTTGIACSSSIKRITYDLVLHRFITLVMCPFCIHTAHTHWRISTLIINRTLFYDTSSSELLWTSFDELELDMTTVTGDDKISEDATLSLSDAAICKIHILFQPGRRFSISDHIYSKCCIPVDRANSNSDRDKTAQQYFAKYSEIWCATVNHNRRLCNQTVSSVTRELLKTQRHRFIPQTF